MAELVAVRGLRVDFASDRGPAQVLDGINLDIATGEVVGLVGESGCGKTTLARAILGILPEGAARIRGGEVRFQGTDLLRQDPATVNERVRGRAITFLPQDPFPFFSPLFPIGTQIMDLMKWKPPRARNGAGPLSIFGRYPRERHRADREAVLDTLRAVQIPEPARALRRLPHEFSGGQRQRLMIALALLPQPDLIIADQPTTALDVTVQGRDPRRPRPRGEERPERRRFGRPRRLAPRRRRRLARGASGRDARPGRRERLRQVDARQDGDGNLRADRGRDPLRRPRDRAPAPPRAARGRQGSAVRLPGPGRLARPPVEDRALAARAAPDPHPADPDRARPRGARDPGAGRPPRRPPRPLPARALRRPAAPGGARAHPDPAAPPGDPGRADLRARRLGPGQRAQAVPEPPGDARAYLRVHLARSRGGARDVRGHRGDVPRQDRRARPDRARLRGAPPSLHAVAAGRG